MGRRAKPAKVKAKAKPPLARKAPMKGAARIHELEQRLAESLEREKATGELLQEKTRALTEAHEQQTATSEVLKVISRSTFDLQPVLETLIENATKLCEATQGNIYRFDGEVFQVGAFYGASSEMREFRQQRDLRPGRGSVVGRVGLEHRTIQILDVLADPDFQQLEAQRIAGFRTVLGIPMLREGMLIGAIAMWRTEVRAFTNKQIELVTTFADQAVIAIENGRLFTELGERNSALNESLEQQTATADILKVISRSPTDVKPVFDVIVENACRLCHATHATAYQFDGERQHFVAHHGVSREAVSRLRALYPAAPEAATITGRAILDRAVIHVPDVADDPQFPLAPSHVRAGRSIVAVPMLRDGEALGAILVSRGDQQPQPFSAIQLELLKTFADQAVIAIENVRLFTELQTSNLELTTALDTQTATSDILRVISGSRTDVQPVFDAIVTSAVRLLRGYSGALTRIAGDQLELAALTSTDDAADTALRARFPQSLQSEGPYAQAIRDRAPLNIADAHTDPRVSEVAHVARRRGFRSQVAVPLLRHDEPIGTIGVTRREPGGFTDDEIALLQTFADQAVIAIENARLLSELQQKNESLTQAHAQVTEALEQQTATSEILRVISSSPTDYQPVFDSIVRNAGSVCAARDALLLLVDGDELVNRAHHGDLETAPIGSRQPIRGTVAGRAVSDARAVHVEDLLTATEFPVGRELCLKFGHRTIVSVPLLRDGEAIGAIMVRRGEVRRFTDKQVGLLQTFAAQAVIALENVRHFTELQASNRELTTALDTQTATSEILSVISASPTDAQPVFETIVRNAVRLCGAIHGGVYRFDGELVHSVAHEGYTPQQLDDWRRNFPRAVTGPGTINLAIRTRTVVRIDDVEVDASIMSTGTVANLRSRGSRSTLAVPMLRQRDVIGVIALAHGEVAAFSDAHVELIKTFADQAVIAIENVRLFTELQASNRELTEALEQQTATSEILKVISSSPTDVQPVFDAIAESAARLCGAFDAVVYRVDGNVLRPVAHHGSFGAVGPLPLVPGTANGRAAIERRLVHVADLQAAIDEFPEGAAISRQEGTRSFVSVPLLRTGGAIGTIAVRRFEIRPFTDDQIALLKTFADQAVIAIENVRLFTELQTSNRELTTALDTQTATSDILRVISRSQTDVQPVFDAIVTSAMRLLGLHASSMTRVIGDQLELAALTTTGEEGDASLRATFPMPLDSDMIHARVVRERVPCNFADAQNDPTLHESVRATSRARGYRSLAILPLLRQDEAIGAIGVTRREPGGFTDDEIALLQTFADQAVIAIENVRLFTELEARNRDLTATSEILQVISRSPTDTQPVFDTIAETAHRLCGSLFSAVFRFDGELLHLSAHHNFPGDAADAYRRVFPAAPTRYMVAGRSVLDRGVAQTVDIEAGAIEPGADNLRQAARTLGVRSILSVPMLRNAEPLGCITVFHREPGAFSDKQIALLRTFADQAVIAIENVRLFTELGARNRDLTEALDRQTATADVLRIIAQSPTELQPVLDAIAASAVRLCGASDVVIERLEGDRFYNAAHAGTQMKGLVGVPLPLTCRFPGGRAILDRKRIIIDDMQLAAETEYPDTLPLLKLNTVRSCAEIPLLSEGKPLGNLAVLRAEVRPFTEAEIALLETFADQAVIAIENVRLFKELEARTQELTRSVEELTALGDVGRALSSTLDLETVLQTIVTRAVQIAGTAGCTIWEYDQAREEFRLRASHYADQGDAAVLEAPGRVTIIPRGQGVTTRVMEQRQPVQIHDITTARDYESPIRRPLVEAGHRALLGVPLLSEDEVIGVLAVTRKTAGEFEPEIVRLLSTFGTQSALAIQNARLFLEIEDKSRQLEAASRHKSEFLASMSHELRTPLNGILGFNEMILDEVYGEIPPDLREPLTEIQNSGRHLLRLINNVLDLSKIEAGRMELALGDYAVQDTVAQVRASLHALAADKGLEFVTAVPADLPLAHGDAGRIAQCLTNLAGNAIKFTRQGRVEIAVELQGELLVYRVSDTGIGIEPDRIGTLFTEFRQADPTIASEFGGSGLGLSITRKFVEMHGGRVWVESEPGKGSRFFLAVPLRLGGGAPA